MMDWFEIHIRFKLVCTKSKVVVLRLQGDPVLLERSFLFTWSVSLHLITDKQKNYHPYLITFLLKINPFVKLSVDCIFNVSVLDKLPFFY